MADEYAAYGVPCLHPPCKVSKLKIAKEETDQGSDEVAIESQFLQHKTKDGSFYYGIAIQTGKQILAGTPDTGVYINLIGSGAHTGKVYIHGALTKAVMKKYIGRGSTDFMLIKSKADHDLGEVLVVVLGIDKKSRLIPDPWFVDCVYVHSFQSNKTSTFPCYHWIGSGDSISFTAHTTTLPSIGDGKNSKILRIQREKQLIKRKMEYKWIPSEFYGLPAHIDASVLNLPYDERFDTTKLLDFTGTGVKDGGRIVFQMVFQGIDNLHDYEKMATTLCRPEIPVHEAARWVTDVEFGRQMLNGVNPVIVEKCTAVPPSFPVNTNDMVKGLLNRGLTLEQEIEAGHIYICDLKILKGIATRQERYCTAPICLLYLNGNDQLVPIAIQLKQDPSEKNPIFLPSDRWIDWLLAKTFYQVAHAQIHELCTHFFSCHAVMEAYSMITNRNLPNAHPIYKLLRPHFRYTMAINAAARASLINTGGIIDQVTSLGSEGKEELFRRFSSVYSVHLTNIERSVQKRKVDNKDLPYYYRDDGIQVWEAIKEFATNIIYEFYQTDEDVQNDEELKSWSEDFYANAFPSSSNGCGFPQQITSREMLAEYCTLIMFTGSAQHASINFGQYFTYGFVPNASLSLRHPPPNQKKKADYGTLLQTLPDMGDTSLQIAIAHLLSQYSQDEIFLGNYPSQRFTEERALKHIADFEKRLAEIEVEIKSRNEKLDVPYIYMMPTKVPNSITI